MGEAVGVFPVLVLVAADDDVDEDVGEGTVMRWCCLCWSLDLVTTGRLIFFKRGATITHTFKVKLDYDIVTILVQTETKEHK